MSGEEGISIRSDVADGTIVVAPTGDVDMSRSPDLRTALRKSQDKKPGKLIVDLTEVGYMDSSGLATLVEAMRGAKATRTELVICGMNDKVRAIFEIARLHHFFPIVETLQDAIAHDA